MGNTVNKHIWYFEQIGGIEQVIFQSADDIVHLDELDPKLWVALSCPASGLEFDSRMLSLLDRDNDNRIRIPDIIDAIKWLQKKLNNLDSLITGMNELPLSVFNTKNKDGKKIFIAAKAILADINKSDKLTISEDDLNESTLLSNMELFNGDGVISVSDKIDTDIQLFIIDAINVIGGVKGANEVIGINNEIAHAFILSLRNWLNWQKSVDSATTIFGEKTEEVWSLINELKEKIDDFFLRVDLVSYAPQAELALNVNEKYIITNNDGLLSDKILSELPLSQITANGSLNLCEGINPMWREKVVQFAKLIRNYISDEKKMTYNEWINIQNLLSLYSQFLSSKPSIVSAEKTIEPNTTIDKLGKKRVNDILKSNLLVRFEELIDKDKNAPFGAKDIADIEKLIIYHKHFYRLLLNFVSFRDFFNVNCGGQAAFQAGKLYIDGRCCLLCTEVYDINKHTDLANYSELFLLYCECTRKNPLSIDSQNRKTIVAAMTVGDADFLFDGRNGVFIDNNGNDWDAKIIKIITKPISINQAIWDPYKRIGRFISEQLNKWATTKDLEMAQSANNTIENITNTEPQKFDIGKNVGILAAVGLALGAIGTALASIAATLFQLSWWQFPLVFAGVFFFISGPSVILAWLKLRQRTLTPLLEASGWAINGRIKINFFLGNLLTSKAKIPNETAHTFSKVYKKNYKILTFFVLAIILILTTIASYLLKVYYFNSIFRNLKLR